MAEIYVEGHLVLRCLAAGYTLSVYYYLMALYVVIPFG
jgi:hypothetical protein